MDATCSTSTFSVLPPSASSSSPGQPPRSSACLVSSARPSQFDTGRLLGPCDWLPTAWFAGSTKRTSGAWVLSMHTTHILSHTHTHTHTCSCPSTNYAPCTMYTSHTRNHTHIYTHTRTHTQHSAQQPASHPSPHLASPGWPPVDWMRRLTAAAPLLIARQPARASRCTQAALAAHRPPASAAAVIGRGCSSAGRRAGRLEEEASIPASWRMRAASKSRAASLHVPQPFVP